MNNTQIDDAHDFDLIMKMHNLIEYSDNYSKTFGILWLYCRDEPVVDANSAIVDFTVANSITDLFKINEKITGETGVNGTKNVETMVPLKYLSNFWRTLEIPLINCEINLDLNCSKNCIIVATDVTDHGATFSITDGKLYVPVVTLSTQDNAKLLGQLECVFKITIYWNKYQSNLSTERQNQYLDYLIDPSFQGVKFLSFKDEAQQTSYS